MNIRTCTLICGICLVSATYVTADMVWHYPFEDLPGAWSDNGRWGQSADSAWIHRDRYIMGGGGGPETKTLMYSNLIVPYGVDSLTVDFDQTYSLTGYAISGTWAASIAFSALVDGSDSYMIVYEDSWGKDASEFSGPSRGHVEFTLPAYAGQDVDFFFDAYTNLTGTISEVHLDWIIWEMTLTGHTSETLENSTWAALKATFRN